MLGLIDESTPTSIRGVHYVIGAAVLLDPNLRDEARARAAKLVGNRIRPFHWREEGVEKRAAMVELLTDLEVGVFAVVHYPVGPHLQAGARARSLDLLVTVLGHEGVDELIIESRITQDDDDRRTLAAAAAAGRVSSALAYSFVRKDDPLMWLPDAVAGAVSEAELRKDDRWLGLQRVAAVLDVRRLDVP